MWLTSRRWAGCCISIREVPGRGDSDYRSRWRSWTCRQAECTQRFSTSPTADHDANGGVYRAAGWPGTRSISCSPNAWRRYAGLLGDPATVTTSRTRPGSQEGGALSRETATKHYRTPCRRSRRRQLHDELLVRGVLEGNANDVLAGIIAAFQQGDIIGSGPAGNRLPVRECPGAAGVDLKRWAVAFRGQQSDIIADGGFGGVGPTQQSGEIDDVVFGESVLEDVVAIGATLLRELEGVGACTADQQVVASPA